MLLGKERIEANVDKFHSRVCGALNEQHAWSLTQAERGAEGPDHISHESPRIRM